MDMEHHFFVEHFITDKTGWNNWFTEFMTLLADPSMTIDKGLQHPDFEGHEAILSIGDGDMMHFCIWKTATLMTKDEFQAFIDRFTGKICTNKVHKIKDGMGMTKLNTRDYMKDVIRMSNGKEMPGYLDRPQLWVTRHVPTSGAKAVEDFNEEIAKKVRTTCTTPSDVLAMFPAGHGPCMLVMCEDGMAFCFEGTEQMTSEDFQKYIDEFMKGVARNKNYLLDTKSAAGAMNLSEDFCAQEMLTWADSYVNPFSKMASHETPEAVMHGTMPYLDTSQ